MGCSKRQIEFVIYLVLGMLSLHCKPQESSTLEDPLHLRTVEWTDLREVGQKFRIGLADQPSKCLLGGEIEMTEANCGDLNHWEVAKVSSPWVKIIRAVNRNRCLAFAANGSLVTTPCDLDSPPRPGTFSPKCGIRGGCKYPEEAEPTIQERQWITVDDDTMVPAYRRFCDLKSEGGKCTRGLMAKGPVWGQSKAVIFTTPNTGKRVKIYGSQALIASRLVSAKDYDGQSEQTFSTEVKYGYIPRITAIYVATDVGMEKYAKSPNSWITGIQIHYSDGSKYIAGQCDLDWQGTCKVHNREHPKYPNPLVFDRDEYVIAIGMKFGAKNRKEAFDGFPYGKTPRLVELMIKTNKSDKKPMLWKGAGEGDAPWQWLSTKEASKKDKPMVIVGMQGDLTRITDRKEGGESPFISRLGVYYANLVDYKGHNRDAFQLGKNGNIPPFDVKKNGKIVGLRPETAKFHNLYFMCPGICRDPNYDSIDSGKRLFFDPGNQFSTTFYPTAMGLSTRIGILRAWLKDGNLLALEITPHSSGDNVVKTETYGDRPRESAQIELMLDEDDFIKTIQVKTKMSQGWVSSGTYSGRKISGLKIVTNKGRTVQHGIEGNEGLELGEPGRAIVGFHGVYVRPAYYDLVKERGILNLGVWTALPSQLEKLK